MLSVIICTWNRCESLHETLISLERMKRPSEIDWELIVVDNNSTDQTSQTIDKFRGRLPIERVFESTAGKSHALNTAVRLARGDYFIFTDDDVLVGNNWLTAYHEAFQRYSDYQLFGGPINPLFQGDGTPAWLISGFSAVANAYAVISQVEAIGAITSESYPYGANMAASREVFDTHLYPVEVGPRPGSKVRGEEMMLIWDILSSGGKGMWIPNAKVNHSIPPTRQTMAYLKDYYVGSGELMDLVDDSDVPLLFGRPRWAWRQAVSEQLHYLLRRYTAPAEVWLHHYRSACIARGLIGGFKRNQ